MAYNPLRHFRLKALSVAIAALLWVLVGGEKIVERSLRVPLELQNMPDGIEMVGETPGTVDVRVRGSSSALGNLLAGDVMAIMDLSNAAAGRRLYHLAPDDVRVPFGVEVKNVTPATTTLVFELTMTKTVPVVPSIDGQPAAGFAVEQIDLVGARVGHNRDAEQRCALEEQPHCARVRGDRGNSDRAHDRERAGSAVPPARRTRRQIDPVGCGGHGARP